MTTNEAGDKTARGWSGRKFYLSDEAVALLVAHCKSTLFMGQRHLSMSAYIDELIKRELGGRAPAAKSVAKVKKVLDEGQRQLAKLTRAGSELDANKPAVLPMTHTNTRVGGEPPRSTRPKVDVRDVVRYLDKKQPTKKDFDLDV